MATDLKIYLASKGVLSGDENTFYCTDQLRMQRDPQLYSFIVDTGESENEPLIETDPVDEDEVQIYVRGVDGEDLDIEYAVQCKAREFNKIPSEFHTYKKNLAIIKFLKSIDPETTVLIFKC